MTLHEIMIDEAKNLGFTQKQVTAADLYSRAINPVTPMGKGLDDDIPEKLEELLRLYMRLILTSKITTDEAKQLSEEIERNIKNN
jgi:hypothetical protein